MVRYDGIRLLHWIARRSLPDSSPSVYESLTRGCGRKFSTATCQPRIFSTPNYYNVGDRNWLRPGIAKANYGAARSIHGTAYMSAKDYYAILGVSKNAPASEVKKAYHGLAKKLHPDLSEDPQAAAKFQEVQKAYEVLSNEEKRSLYDQIGHEGYETAASGGGPGGGPDPGAWGGPGGGTNPFDIFENLVNPFREMGGSTVKIAVELSFMEAVQGCTKTVSYNTELSCESCGDLRPNSLVIVTPSAVACKVAKSLATVNQKVGCDLYCDVGCEMD